MSRHFRRRNLGRLDQNNLPSCSVTCSGSEAVFCPQRLKLGSMTPLILTFLIAPDQIGVAMLIAVIVMIAIVALMVATQGLVMIALPPASRAPSFERGKRPHSPPALL